MTAGLYLGDFLQRVRGVINRDDVADLRPAVHNVLYHPGYKNTTLVTN